MCCYFATSLKHVDRARIGNIRQHPSYKRSKNVTPKWQVFFKMKLMTNHDKPMDFKNHFMIYPSFVKRSLTYRNLLRCTGGCRNPWVGWILRTADARGRGPVVADGSRGLRCGAVCFP
jgi:hypothetical protein